VTTQRNAAVLAATGATVGLLFLYPTSTNSSRHAHTTAAPAGIVAKPTTKAATAGPRTVVVNGTAADTQYGPVQVQLRVRGGHILAASAIVYPTGSGRDREINNYAIPLLERETVQAQSAHIDMVSGATYTSDGYRRSLQSALDAAHVS